MADMAALLLSQNAASRSFRLSRFALFFLSFFFPPFVFFPFFFPHFFPFSPHFPSFFFPFVVFGG